MQKHGASFFVFSGKPFHCNTKGVSKYLQFKVGNQPLTGLYAADRHLTHLQTTATTFLMCLIIFRILTIPPCCDMLIKKMIKH